MDIRMPVMDGLEATQQIRMETGAGPAPVIVALTASGFEEQRASILRTGCDDFLRKPFKEEALFDVLVHRLDAAFEYEDEEPAADAGTPDLDGVPQALRVRLLGALERLDVLGVEAAIEAVSQVDAQAAHGLTAMASRFEYESISALLKTG